MKIRAASASDLDAIFAIYDHEVRSGTATFDTEVYTPERRQRFFDEHRGGRYPLLVAETLAQGVIGWASLSPWSDRCAYARAAEVSVYVADEHHGRGAGAALLGALIEAGRAAGLGVLLARITSESEASVRLHERMGFQLAGTLHRVGEKFGRILDVAIYELPLD